MAELGTISDETFAEAGALIRAVAGVGPRPEVEIRPGLEQMVAGAALSLSEGAPPSTFWESGPSRAEDYLTEGREEWRHFHAAVARVIDIERKQPNEFETPGDVMTHIAGDVMTQARARRMALAIDNTDPAFQKHLSNASRDTVLYAREDPEIAGLIRAEARGDYAQFDSASRSDIASNIINGEYVTKGIEDGIGIAATAIDRHIDALPAIERDRDSRLADFADFGTPLFPTPTDAHWERASGVATGKIAPLTAVERGIVAHVALEEHDAALRKPSASVDLDTDMQSAERLGGYARALARSDEPRVYHVDAAIEAARIEADIVGLRTLQDSASRSMFENLDNPMQDSEIGYQRGLLALAAGNIEKADPQVQMSTFAAIRDLDGVAPMRAIDLSFAAAAVERGDLVVGVAREVKENDMKRVISYEGQGIAEMQAQDKRWRDSYYMPGDNVRINDEINVVGVDRDELRGRIGAEPLEIERMVMRGDERSNGNGGTYLAPFPEYQFKGVEGRFPAHQFQHERGDEHHYGAMVMKDEKLWFVPLSDDLDNPKAIGAAREVTATISSPVDMKEGMQTLPEMKQLFRTEQDVSGEFVVRPEAFGQKAGPVELVAIPWMSGLSDVEKGLANKAIEQAERSERPSIGAAVGAAMAGQGR